MTTTTNNRTIRSKPGPLKIVLLFFTFLAAAGGIGALTGIKPTQPQNNGKLFDQLQPNEQGAVAILVAIVLFLLIQRFYYSVTIRKESISLYRFFKRHIIYDTDIVSIDLFRIDRIDERCMYIIITLQDGKTYKLPAHDFSNTGRIRAALFERFNNKIVPFPGYNNNLQRQSYASKKKYAGNPFLGFSFFLTIGMVLLFSIIADGSTGGWITVGVAALLPLILWAFSSYYFELASGKLIVKNHLFFWLRREYELKDIRFVMKGEILKGTTGLRIVKSNFRARGYAAETLRQKHWNELRDDLKKQGVATV